jgi:hypothetical protein
LFLAFTSGCAAVAVAAPVACHVVSVLNDACMVLTFVGADGKPHTVTCTREELTAWGARVEAEHAAAAASAARLRP